MSVYPYEVPLVYMDAHNDNGMGGIDIIYKKEIVRKIPGKGGCQETPITDFIQCINTKLIEALEKSDVKCKVPALNYTDFDTFGEVFFIILILKCKISKLVLDHKHNKIEKLF